MILHTFDIDVKHHGDNEPVLLMPVGDIQWFGEHQDVALKMLRRHIQWGVDHNAYFIGMGDYVDTFSPSNRQRLQAAGIYDSGKKFIDKSAKALVRELYEEAFAPSRGRWLGLLAGHHYHRYSSGATTDHDLCELLDTRFLGDCTITRMRFNYKPAAKATVGTVSVWAHHGVGSGSRIAAPLNKLDALPVYWPDCQIFLIGHHHKKVAAPIDQCVPVWPHSPLQEPKLIHRTAIAACTGGFLKGYVEGRESGTYVEKGMLSPVALGGVLIKITPRWISKFNTRIWLPDLKVEQ